MAPPAMRTGEPFHSSDCAPLGRLPEGGLFSSFGELGRRRMPDHD
jgi:hypothetical protein